jgi:signal transduction histidine kinase
MSSRIERGWRWCAQHAGVLAALALAGAAALTLALRGLFASPAELLGSSAALTVVALLARRRHPVIAAVVAGVLLTVPTFTPGIRPLYADSVGLTAIVLAAVFLFAYTLGVSCPWELSLVGLVPLAVGLGIAAATVNPLVGMITIGPWLAGVLVASRQRAAARLEVRARELDEERDAFATESVRYERARIARELHDIVAHSVSLMVVQAGAGAHLVGSDRRAAAEAFDSILVAARESEVEIDRLTELLKTSRPAASQPWLRVTEELIDRAKLSGLTVSCRFIGDVDGLAEDGGDAVHRLVQEALTNAVKHAEGAPVDILVRGGADAVTVSVTNGPARTAIGRLTDAGGGRGLAGMRERIAACGGTVSAGPTQEQGWQVVASLPLRTPSDARVDRT